MGRCSDLALVTRYLYSLLRGREPVRDVSPNLKTIIAWIFLRTVTLLTQYHKLYESAGSLHHTHSAFCLLGQDNGGVLI